MRRAIYAGSFDPWTEGHQDVLREALEIFDEVIVAILQNPDKRPLFAAERRSDMISAAIAGEMKEDESRVEVIINTVDLAVNVARHHGAYWMVRGLRLGGEYEKELAACLVNAALDYGIQTIYIPPKQEHIHISSTVVRQLINIGRVERTQGLVPFPVYELIIKGLEENR